VSQHTRPQVDASLIGSVLTRQVRIVDVLLFSVYVGDVVSVEVVSAESCHVQVHIGHRVRDLSIVGVQGNVIGGRKKYVLDHSWILSLKLHCFELCLI